MEADVSVMQWSVVYIAHTSVLLRAPERSGPIPITAA